VLFDGRPAHRAAGLLPHGCALATFEELFDQLPTIRAIEVLTANNISDVWRKSNMAIFNSPEAGLPGAGPPDRFARLPLQRHLQRRDLRHGQLHNSLAASAGV
jgi:hypothetical protein